MHGIEDGRVTTAEGREVVRPVVAVVGALIRAIGSFRCGGVRGRHAHDGFITGEVRGLGFTTRY